MKRICIMTTGGDASGMNAAIRAVTRTAIGNNLEVLGIEKGFRGLVNNKFVEMSLRSVSGIINRGGTILQTLRAKEFHDRKIRETAYRHISAMRVDGIVVIGGDGSRMGAYTITKETGIPTVFIPGSIDNDVYGTDYTIGFDTAVNVGLDAIDKIRDTADSHERIFIVEVMGREHGFLALEIGVTGGAEVILIPEFKDKISVKNVCDTLEQGVRRGKDSSIVVVAEGYGATPSLAKAIEKRTGMETRYTVLGYIQRGGKPTAMSRKLGLVFGYQAVKALMKMKKGESKMTAMQSSGYRMVEMKDVIKKEKKISMQEYQMNTFLSL